MHFPHLDPAIAVNPSADRVERLFAADGNSPALILNLHEYHVRARYPEGYVDSRNPPDVGGREAYHRYFDGVLERILPQVPGVRLVVAPCELTLIGDRNWHEAVIGYYPTRKAMLQIASLPDYAALVVHRTAGLKAALTVALQSLPACGHCSVIARAERAQEVIDPACDLEAAVRVRPARRSA